MGPSATAKRKLTARQQQITAVLVCTLLSHRKLPKRHRRREVLVDRCLTILAAILRVPRRNHRFELQRHKCCNETQRLFLNLTAARGCGLPAAIVDCACRGERLFPNRRGNTARSACSYADVRNQAHAKRGWLQEQTPRKEPRPKTAETTKTNDDAS